MCINMSKVPLNMSWSEWCNDILPQWSDIVVMIIKACYIEKCAVTCHIGKWFILLLLYYAMGM